MYCPSCGALVPDTYAVCPNCGVKAQPGANAGDEAEQRPIPLAYQRPKQQFNQPSAPEPVAEAAPAPEVPAEPVKAAEPVKPAAPTAPAAPAAPAKAAKAPSKWQKFLSRLRGS